MRICFVGMLVIWASIGLLACSEEESFSTVEGSFNCDQCGSWKVDGTLAKGDGDYYGHCKLDGDKFSFVVGSRSLNDATTAQDSYYEFSGIKGPPTKGVFDGDKPKEDKDLRTTFERGFVKKVNEWTFDVDDVTGDDPEESCNVSLFAESKDELTPNKKPFDYYVHVLCGNMEAETPNGPTLRSVEVKVYFDSCDE